MLGFSFFLYLLAKTNLKVHIPANPIFVCSSFMHLYVVFATFWHLHNYRFFLAHWFSYIIHTEPLPVLLQTRWTFGLLQFQHCSTGYFKSAFHLTAMFSVHSRPAYSSPSRPDLMHMWARSVHFASLLSHRRLSLERPLSLSLIYGRYLSALLLPILSFSFRHSATNCISIPRPFFFSSAADYSTVFLIWSGSSQGMEGLLSPLLVHFFFFHRKLFLFSPWSLHVCG